MSNHRKHVIRMGQRGKATTTEDPMDSELAPDVVKQVERKVGNSRRIVKWVVRNQPRKRRHLDAA